ncbi:MAG: chloride channel protein [Asgard group archaeon]|nr:chloride channel protein [Asgard group archaeon]
MSKSTNNENTEKTNSPNVDDLEVELIHKAEKTDKKTLQEKIKKLTKRKIATIDIQKRHIKELFSSRQFKINSIAILMGIFGALIVWGFEWVTVVAKEIFLGTFFQLFAEDFGKVGFLAIILIPVLGTLITAPLVKEIAPETRGSGVPAVMESIVFFDGYVRKRTPFVKIGTTAISLGSGLSVGREGPIAQIGAGISSIFARLFKLRGRSMKIVVISGLSAAIAAMFNSPIGGALFGIEILLVSIVADEIIPIILSSITATTLSMIIDLIGLTNTSKIQPPFQVPSLQNLGLEDYLLESHWLILFGFIAGVIGILYTKCLHWIRKGLLQLKIPIIYVPIIGAFLAGTIGIFSPKDEQGIPLIFGGGYTTIANILNNSQNITSQSIWGSTSLFLFVLLILKVIITVFSVGSGNPGGIFAPALFIGACSGSFFGHFFNELFNTALQPSLFAISGFAAVFAGATRAPLTMIFMGAEMTGNILLSVPLMLTCSISYIICRLTLKESIYTQSLVDQGIKITLGGNVAMLTTTKVKEIMSKDVITVQNNERIDSIATKIMNKNIFSFPVITSENNLIGLITIDDVKRARFADNSSMLAKDYMSPNFVCVVANDTVDDAINILERNSVKRAPVINNLEEKKLVGIISETDILRCFEQQKLHYITQTQIKR